MASTFRIPETVVTGWGCFDELGRLAAPLGRRALLVTGRSAMTQAGHTDRAIELLRSSGVEPVLWDQCDPEPEVASVDAAREVARDSKVDLVIGLGGGSAIDLAKAVAGLSGETAPTSAFHDGREISAAGLPFIAIPATSGTGSEMTINSVISDRRRHIKASIRHERFMARVALVDPQLTVSCPPSVTAASGLDALSQAIESYASIHATTITEALSLRATVELAASIDVAVHWPEDRQARNRATDGSLMAGMALGNARLGVIHGIVHPLGVRYDIPHGLACGVFLPLALEYNREAMGEKYRTLEVVLGADPAEFAHSLLDRVGLPHDFKDRGINPKDFGTIADESLPSGSLKANPRPVTRDDVIAMLEKLC